MKNLLAFEFRKLFRSKTFYIILSIIVANALLQSVFLYLMMKDAGPEEFMPTAFSLLKNTAYSDMLLLCFGVFISLFALDDSSCGALKTVYGKGYPRKSVFAAKFLIAELCLVFFFAVACGLNFACGLLFFQKGSAAARLAITLFVQLIVLLSYGAVYFFFTAVCKKIGGAIAAAIFLPSVYELSVSILGSWILKHNREGVDLTKYTLSSLLNELAANEISAKTLVFCLVVALVYGAVFTLFSYLLHRKREV